jgi:hypothetical protein
MFLDLQLRNDVRAVSLDKTLKTVQATMINIVDCLYYMFNYKVSRFVLENFADKRCENKRFFGGDLY